MAIFPFHKARILFSPILCFVLLATAQAQDPLPNDDYGSPLVIDAADPDLDLDLILSEATSQSEDVGSSTDPCSLAGLPSVHFLLLNHESRHALVQLDTRGGSADTGFNVQSVDPAADSDCVDTVGQPDEIIVLLPPAAGPDEPSETRVTLFLRSGASKQAAVDRARVTLRKRQLDLDVELRQADVPTERPVPNRAEVRFDVAFKLSNRANALSDLYVRSYSLLLRNLAATVSGANAGPAEMIVEEELVRTTDAYRREEYLKGQVVVRYLATNPGTDTITVAGNVRIRNNGNFFEDDVTFAVDGVGTALWRAEVANDRCSTPLEIGNDSTITQDVEEAGYTPDTTVPGSNGTQREEPDYQDEPRNRPCEPSAIGDVQPNRSTFYKYTNNSDGPKVVTVRVRTSFRNVFQVFRELCGQLTAASIVGCGSGEFDEESGEYITTLTFIARPGEMLTFYNYALFDDEALYGLTIETTCVALEIECDLTIDRPAYAAASGSLSAPVNISVHLEEPVTGLPIAGRKVLASITSGPISGFRDVEQTTNANGDVSFQTFTTTSTGTCVLKISNAPGETPEFYCETEFEVASYRIDFQLVPDFARPGETVRIEGRLFRRVLSEKPAPNEVISVTVTRTDDQNEVLSDVTTDANGRFSVSYTASAERGNGAERVSFVGTSRVEEYIYDAERSYPVRNSPTNDARAEAQPIDPSTSGALEAVDLTDATVESDEPASAAGPVNRTAWYKLMLPEGQGPTDVSVDTFGSGADTVIDVYEQDENGNLTPVTSANNNNPDPNNPDNNLNEVVQFVLQPGKCYLVRVGIASESSFGADQTNVRFLFGLRLTLSLNDDYFVIGSETPVLSAELTRNGQPLAGGAVTVRIINKPFATQEDTQETDLAGMASYQHYTPPTDRDVYRIEGVYTDPLIGGVVTDRIDLRWAYLSFSLNRIPAEGTTVPPGTSVTWSGKVELEVPTLHDDGSITVERVPLSGASIGVEIVGANQQTLSTTTVEGGAFIVSYPATNSGTDSTTFSAAVGVTVITGPTVNTTVGLSATNGTCATGRRVVTTGPATPKGLMEEETPFVDVAVYTGAGSSPPTPTCSSNAVNPALYYIYVNKTSEPQLVTAEARGFFADFPAIGADTAVAIFRLRAYEPDGVPGSQEEACSAFYEQQCFDRAPDSATQALGRFIAEPNAPYMIVVGTNNRDTGVEEITVTIDATPMSESELPQYAATAEPKFTVLEPSDLDQTVPVTFTLTLDGQPVAGRSVTLERATATGGFPISATTDANGEVSALLTVPGGTSGTTILDMMVRLDVDGETIPLSTTTVAEVTFRSCDIDMPNHVRRVLDAVDIVARVFVNGAPAPDGTSVLYIVREPAAGNQIVFSRILPTVGGLGIMSYTHPVPAVHTVEVTQPGVDAPFSCSAQVTWLDVSFAVNPTTQTLTLGRTATITGEVRRNGVVAANVPVDISFTFASASARLRPARQFTNGAGAMQLRYGNALKPGLDQVVFEANIDGLVLDDLATVLWEAAPSCDLSAEPDVLDSGASVTLTYRLLDELGVPVSGALASAQVAEGPNAGLFIASEVTDQLGEATFSYTSQRGGIDTIRVEGSSGFLIIACETNVEWLGPSGLPDAWIMH
ncbi:hypothetical protein GC173_15140 [bacterium]|nr:hypothetical protein [bacterium]